MNREELIQLVDRIMKCEGTEEEQDALLALLENNILDPQVSNYIFYENNTPEEVVDKALAYKPIILWFDNLQSYYGILYIIKVKKVPIG